MVILKHFLFSFHLLLTLSQVVKDFKISNFCVQHVTECKKVQQYNRKHRNVFYCFSIAIKTITVDSNTIVSIELI